MKSYKIEGELVKKYRGCGAALARIQLRFEGRRRFLDKLVDFDYVDCSEDGVSRLVRQQEQSVHMSRDAGCIDHYEDAAGNRIKSDLDFNDGFEKIESGVFAVVVVNISCYEACLA